MKDYVRNDLNIAKFGEKIFNMVEEYGTYSKENMVPTPVNFDIKLMSTPAKDKLSAIKYLDDVIKVVMTDGDVEAEWEKVREGYKQYGIEEAINEVNAKAKELGLKNK